MSTGNLIPIDRPHAAALAAIHAACFPEEPWSPESIGALLENPVTFGYLNPSGGMVLARAVAGEAEILVIGVAPEARRRGLGRRLLDAALGDARSRHAEMMFLEVEAGNHPAVALYIGAGFRQSGRRPDYYGPGRDALLLSLPLS